MAAHPVEEGGVTRRGFLAATSALLASRPARAAGPGPGAFGIAYTSMGIRARQARRPKGAGPGLPAEEFIDRCRAFGAAGCQMDIAQLTSDDAGYLRRIRQAIEEREMFLELSVGARLLGDPDAFGRAAAIARALGVSRLRVAINGRRYEEFFSREAWSGFADRWQKTLHRAAPMLEHHRIRVGVENHKEWLSGELADMLGRVGSPYLGACVDFGNNLALLEEAMAVAEVLAPFAVTTHLKDMAVAEAERGFLLSEVPLGQGILPLAAIMDRLRRSNPDIHFCLEMITRDPLTVPCLDDAYWASRDPRDAARMAELKARVLGRPRTDPLPTVGQLDAAASLAAEDDNIRRSAAYYRETLAG